MVRYIRTSGLVLLMAAITLAPVAPVYAQAAQSGQQQAGEQQSGQAATPQQSGQANPIPTVTVQQPGPPPPPAAAKKISDTGSREYSYGKPWFPTILAPYTQMEIPMPDLVNTPDIDGFIQNGKLTLSLQDAVALALKNNLDIQVQRYNPWIAEAAVLKARVGPNGTFDPLYQFTAGDQIFELARQQPVHQRYWFGKSLGDRFAYFFNTKHVFAIVFHRHRVSILTKRVTANHRRGEHFQSGGADIDERGGVAAIVEGIWKAGERSILVRRAEFEAD